MAENGQIKKINGPIKLKKKLFLIIPTLTQGGAEKVVTTLIKFFDRKKFQITLLVISMKEEVYRKDIPSDVKIIDLKCQHVRTAMPRIILNLWRYRPNIVLSTLGHLNVAIAMARFLMPPKIKFLARETIVVSEKISRGRFPALWRFWYRHYYPSFAKIICLSEDMMTDLAGILRSDKNLALINNPVDYKNIQKLANHSDIGIENYFKEKSSIHFVAAGRLMEQKGFELLIEAMALIRNPSVRLAILGHGPLEEKLRKLIETYGLQAQIVLAGYQSNPYAWMARADAFILSSYYEGFPNVVLEALSCGTQVIATPAPGGIKEILEPIAGCFLADCITASSLADSISLYINSGKHEIQESDIERYKPLQICNKYTDLFLNQ